MKSVTKGQVSVITDVMAVATNELQLSGCKSTTYESRGSVQLFCGGESVAYFPSG